MYTEAKNCPCTRITCKRYQDCEACMMFHQKVKRYGLPMCQRPNKKTKKESV